EEREVVPCAVDVRTVLSVARDRTPDQSGIVGGELHVAEPQLVVAPRPSGFDQHVDGAGERAYDCGRAFVLQVEGDRPLAAVVRDVRSGDPADRVAAPWLVDAHDVGTEIGQEFRAVRPGLQAREVEYA